MIELCCDGVTGDELEIACIGADARRRHPETQLVRERCAVGDRLPRNVEFPCIASRRAWRRRIVTRRPAIALHLAPHLLGALQGQRDRHGPWTDAIKHVAEALNLLRTVAARCAHARAARSRSSIAPAASPAQKRSCPARPSARASPASSSELLEDADGFGELRS